MTVRSLVLAGCLLNSVAVRAAADAGTMYLQQVKPLLQERCYACHGALKQEGGLRLDTGASVRRGSAERPVVLPGQPAQSLLLDRVSRRDDERMPPEGEGAPLTADEVDVLRRWIAAGAPSPADEDPQPDPRTFWSYQAVRKPAVPVVQRRHWVRNPIDAFIAATHEELGLSPQPEADREVWLRRVTFDLTGLPPTPDDVTAFLADERPEAFEAIVDRLLDSPAYGQRWGRHWMDVWRYSDWYGSRGINEIRYSQRHIWRWRDWIVESLNADVGYDDMLRQMLAGDELAPGNPNVNRATGFIGRNWYKFDRNVWMFDAVEHTAQAFLGVTLRCCRCHDHKYDPLSQTDYYRFRAYFEPHDVRTDPLTGDLSTEKDATLGQVLKTGVALVYDKSPDAPTYLFRRGDNRYPDESRPLSPGVPMVFGVEPPEVQPIALPVTAWFPALRPEVLNGLRDTAAQTIAAARRDVEAARQAVRQAEADLTAFLNRQPSDADRRSPMGTVFRDDFSAPRPEVWTVRGGEWTYASGKVTQSNTGTFPTLEANVPHPRNFIARYRYRTLEAGSIHSVGFFFDVSPLANCQAVYTATNNAKSSVQAFHRTNGREEYPAAGIVPWPIRIGEDTTIELAVRDQLLNVWVNGELAIAYQMPLPRRDGTFALWTHAGAAEFDELTIDPLPSGLVLAEQKSSAGGMRSPYSEPTELDFRRQIAAAQQRVQLAERHVAVAEAAQHSLNATIAAELSRADALLSDPPSADRLLAAHRAGQVAARAQRDRAAMQAERELQQAVFAVEQAESAVHATEEARQKAVKDAEQKRSAAQTALDAARQALTKTDADYEPLGATYPQSSTGRRTALANWIVDPRHPRTARVAVNHLWLRHFGEALVPTVANFGLNGQPPTHPELLDWLAAEFIEHRWSMKHLHRLMVTSATYRMTARDADADANRQIDPANRFYWRMNSRRLEAEAIRDSVWYLAERLDPSFGGPEISESQGEQSSRRSLYFRSTPNEKMNFLEFFDRANPNECYRRQESVVPQQALALVNSTLTLEQAQVIARLIERDVQSAEAAGPDVLVEAAFLRVLSRSPRSEERALCRELLVKRPTALDQLVHVLLNHNDFVTVR